ncbi:MAG: hypothetical protein WA952_17840 [Lewinella sp.]
MPATRGNLPAAYANDACQRIEIATSQFGQGARLTSCMPVLPGLAILILGFYPLLVVVIGQAGIPVEGIALIFGVARPLDMCRTIALSNHSPRRLN